MDSGYTLFIVDDVEVSRRLIESTFGQTYDVESFASGTDCLERMTTKIPDLFLLDVDMPGMDGYSLCRNIKSRPDSKSVPVIFISALDDLESRLAGYDAGGEDFIVKPFKLAELKQKVEILRRIGQEKSALQNRLDESDTLTSLVLSSLDEYAVLVKFLRSLNGCANFPDVAEALLTMLKAYQLEGALQFRLPDFEMTMNQKGESSPLEAAIISHVRSMGSVAEFKSRAAFNFGQVSVLINNMPLGDSEKCGRIRDHLAIATESAEAKLLALQARMENTATRAEISAMLKDLGDVIHTFSAKYEKARLQGTQTVHLMLDELGDEFVSLGMREVQEESIRTIIQTRTDQLIDIFDFSNETVRTLNSLSSRLGHTLETRE